MPKLHCDHRVVMRNPEGEIILDLPYENFAQAKPEYDRWAVDAPLGHELTIQHGARIIFKTSR